MPRYLSLMLSLASLLGAAPQEQQKQQTPRELQKQRPQTPVGSREVDPPEEDKAVAPTEYSFNPLQAEKDLKVGNYYWKLGKLRAAEARFREATRRNEGYGEAWLRLGEVEEKLKDPKAARDAYTKYLQLAADAKNAADIRKRLEKLK